MSQLLSQSWLGRLCDAFDRALIDLNVLPRRTRTEGKSLLLALSFVFMCWATVHFHFGYLNFLLSCVPIGIILSLMYAEAELRKDD
ncbi:hypothetical protein TrVE_jg10164 [Triparma verrucosa]|uniref:Uncharacterized protein n=2 Tax=Triparma TaxID=722752 RepID=A0A9W7C9R6_9STRA|nr:hypothetical protein TrVE_jg10164 [Triparma verrucosa]GMI02602.1 hypothetical protein TrST_g12440 [Triparma strigata]